MGFLILDQWRITISVHKLYRKRRLSYGCGRVASNCKLLQRGHFHVQSNEHPTVCQLWLIWCLNLSTFFPKKVHFIQHHPYKHKANWRFNHLESRCTSNCLSASLPRYERQEWEKPQQYSVITTWQLDYYIYFTWHFIDIATSSKLYYIFELACPNGV